MLVDEPVASGRKYINVCFRDYQTGSVDEINMTSPGYSSVLLLYGCSHMFRFNPINHYKVQVVSVDEEFSRIPGHYVFAQGEGSFNIIRKDGLAVARVLKGNSAAV